MGQKFMVTYDPSQWNAPAGGVATSWSTPYGGLHTMTPENLIGPSFTPAVNNFFFRNSELRSRPAFSQLFPGPDGNNLILACGSFLSQNLVWHTFSMTPRGLFQLKTNSQAELARGYNPWVYLGGPPMLTSPVSWQCYNGVLYYSNGEHLSAWDGSANTPLTDVAFVGASPTSTVYGGVFVTELDDHIILAYVYESGLPFANRIRWSNNGFSPTIVGGAFGGNLGTIGATFDPSINLNAGFNDFLDVPDIITGVMTIGREGYIFRQNGITHLTPTGNGVAPFDFNHLWASQNGIGSIYPFTLAQYGNMGIFIAFEQVYQITPGGINPIGGGARDAIMSDLAKSTGSPKASIDRGFKLGYTYLNYHLRIPLANDTRSYVFSVEDNNWTSWTESGVWPTGQPNECWI